MEFQTRLSIAWLPGLFYGPRIDPIDQPDAQRLGLLERPGGLLGGPRARSEHDNPSDDGCKRGDDGHRMKPGRAEGEGHEPCCSGGTILEASMTFRQLSITLLSSSMRSSRRDIRSRGSAS
jgi:hypothetical protein